MNVIWFFVMLFALSIDGWAIDGVMDLAGPAGIAIVSLLMAR